MKEFDELVDVVRKLRAPGGCPWDREQTRESLVPYFLEEAHEVIETIESKEINKLKYELGDVMLHLVFQTVIAEENKEFTFEDVLNGIKDKMVTRHPHVFDPDSGYTAEEANATWEIMKSKKKKGKLLDGIPKTLPELHRSFRMQQKAAAVGFDWDDVSDVWKKVYEEIEEFKEAFDSGDKDHAKEEFGDILFALVNLSRFYDIHPGQALQHSNNKFYDRFAKVEEHFKKSGESMKDAGLEKLDGVWEDVKRQSKGQK
ncbi:MAG: nucleoside triphosphate pyrophosphohydrolase [Candidatus Marinimicrobia bacterium]|nr:nucleoside triphosphate pyrophosphohydrolase [Candidatus Neomarinimicrobiota bacterium]